MRKRQIDLLQAIASADLVVVGSGLYGLTVAEFASREFNKRVVIIEKRNHFGGNAYSYLDEETGIEIHKYGSHLFHTSNKSVFEYISKFTLLNSYRHRVKARAGERFFDMPINLSTLSLFFEKALSPSEAKKLLQAKVEHHKFTDPQNLEEFSQSIVGDEIYRKLIRGYTLKQWQKDPKELPNEIIKRIPLRLNFNGDYFDDLWQGLPKDGYSKWFTKMLDSEKIKLFLNTDFFDLRNEIQDKKIVYTGPIDKFFDYKFGHMQWRTLDLVIERFELEDFQGMAVVNYADEEVPWTRIHEFKHLHPERKYKPGVTLTMKEFSRWASKSDECYYPVNGFDDRVKLKKYRELSKTQSNVWFGGRLGSYQYLDMHMAIASALSFMRNDFHKWFTDSNID